MSDPSQDHLQNASQLRYVRVALRLATPQPFEYAVPDGLAVVVGSVVAVSVRGKAMRGVVVEVEVTPNTPRARIRPIERVEAVGLALAPDQIKLCQFVATYYRAPLGMAFALAMPPETVAEKKSTSAPKVFLSPNATEIVLNAAQRAAADGIIGVGGSAQVICLRGVTGSGKTEVYVEAIRAALAAGGQALVLVPEINLTPQWMSRLGGQLPDARIVALHSGLSDGERFRAWGTAARGEADVVFGTRMAVFAPLPRLALIVVDEEHDASFKQQETPRYHARDLAVLRGRLRQVPVVLGSATPSLETVANVQKQRYQLHRLDARARPNARTPALHLIPARESRKTEGLSSLLLRALDDRLARGEQSLVFINRRGFSPFLHCHVCDWQSHCVDCDARMVFHAFDNKLRCHHCGCAASVPEQCPSCGNVELLPMGAGTQKVEAFLRRRYPEAKIARADADTTRGKHDWRAIYDAMAAGEIDILVGTQMIAKGHDFPRLTLVGVLGADDALYSPDFRSPERLFAQLSQVAGRAGRDALPGEVLIQTDMPDHPVFRALVADDADAFAQHELTDRAAAQLPPAHALALIRAEAADSNAAHNALKRIARAIQSSPGVVAFPPVPSPLARRANRFRWQLMVTALARSDLHAALQRAEHAAERTPEVNLSIDVDPLDLT